VRPRSRQCPFCGLRLSSTPAPLGGFLGVLLGVSVAACGGKDDDGGNDSVADSATSTSGATGDDGVDGNDDTAQPLYGPITTMTGTGATSEDSTAGTGATTDASSSTGGSDGTGGETDTGAATTLGPDDSAGPLYGPVTTGG
jgi:hypothetical protein